MTSSRDLEQARRKQVAEEAFAKEKPVRDLIADVRDGIATKIARLRELRLAKEGTANREPAAKPEKGPPQVTPAQCRAARGIAFMTQWQLAEAAQVPRSVIIDFEHSLLPPKPAYLEAIRRVLQERNVEFIDGDPPSVRLKI